LKTKNRKPPQFKTLKQRGEWVEMKFMVEATRRGLVVAKPFGESSRYDSAVESHGSFHRVQVKSTIMRREGAYTCCCRTGRGLAYSAREVDFIAAYVIPEDAWYIIPASVAGSRHWLLLYPHRRSTQSNLFEQYREAWHLLLNPIPSNPRT
jgi:hypothetical protein